MLAGDAEPIREPLLEPDEFSTRPEEVCQIDSMPGVQFEASGDGQAEPSDIGMCQGVRADGEADANVGALVPPVGMIEMPIPDQREKEPILSQGMISNAVSGPAGAAGCSQDDVYGNEIILHCETSPSGLYGE
jgi:hypothetical protein